jgi:tRNA-2-methylthio-N6-dimethylallyladenosine synthase
MNRGYTADQYLELVDNIRAKMPDAAITSDVIVGYPGETEQQFRNTLNVMRKAQFDACNTAAYSVRPGTAASKLEDNVPDAVKQERLQEAMKVVEDVARKQNENLIGSIQEVLVDHEDKGQASGRTRTNKIVKFASRNNLLAKLVNVKIEAAGSWVLQGSIYE